MFDIILLIYLIIITTVNAYFLIKNVLKDYESNKQSDMVYYLELIKTLSEYYIGYFKITSNKILNKNELKDKIFGKIINDIDLNEMRQRLGLTDAGVYEFIMMIINEYVEKQWKFQIFWKII